MKLIPTIASKGGVGKTLVSINVAYSLKELGYKVGLLDLDLTMPAVTKYLKLHGINPGTGKQLEPVDCNGVQVLSAGLLMDKDQPVTVTAEMRRNIVSQFVGKTQWNVDYLVIDTPPGSNDELMELINNYRSSILGCIVVTTPSDTAINEVRRSLELIRREKLPLIGIIGNFMGFECISCHTMNNLFTNGHANPVDSLAEDFRTTVLATLPLYSATDSEPLHFVPVMVLALDSTKLF
jgi:ATP-binding protein involved in chromosome partitioning